MGVEGEGGPGPSRSPGTGWKRSQREVSLLWKGRRGICFLVKKKTTTVKQLVDWNDTKSEC